MRMTTIRALKFKDAFNRVTYAAALATILIVSIEVILVVTHFYN